MNNAYPTTSPSPFSYSKKVRRNIHEEAFQSILRRAYGVQLEGEERESMDGHDGSLTRAALESLGRVSGSTGRGKVDNAERARRTAEEGATLLALRKLFEG